MNLFPSTDVGIFSRLAVQGPYYSRGSPLFPALELQSKYLSVKYSGDPPKSMYFAEVLNG